MKKFWNEKRKQCKQEFDDTIKTKIDKTFTLTNNENFVTGREILIDGLPITELLTMSEVDSELNANVKTKILKK